MKKDKGKIAVNVLYALTRPLAILPLSLHRAFGKFLGYFIGRIARYRRDVVISNLARCFPQKKYDEISSICNRFYAHFGKVVTETIWFSGCTNPARLVKSQIVKLENPELANRLYDMGKSLVLLASHCGNWELFGGAFNYAHPFRLNYPENNICAVYRNQSSPVWTSFLKKSRIAPIKDKQNYDGLVESMDAMKYILSHRDERHIYLFINDQYPYTPKSKVPINFMNQQTWAMDAAVHLANRLGFAVMYLSYKEKEDGNYSMSFIPMCDDASTHDRSELLDRYFRLLEKDLAEQPWNYLWTHKRWK